MAPTMASKSVPHIGTCPYSGAVYRWIVCVFVLFLGLRASADPEAAANTSSRESYTERAYKGYQAQATQASTHSGVEYIPNLYGQLTPMHMALPAAVIHGNQQELQQHQLQNVDVDGERERGFKAWLEFIEKTSGSPSQREFGASSTSTIADREEAQEEDWDERFAGNKISDPDDNDFESLKSKSGGKNKLKPKMRITVAKDGSGDFSRIQDAVNHVPKTFNKRVVIRIKAGVYREKVRIHKDKPYITFLGDKRNRTIITYDSTAGDRSGKHHLPLRTYQSATVAVNSKFFIAKNIVFQNSAPEPAPGVLGRQAVAFRISADMAAFYKCSFLGRQDTLYDHNGRHYFKNCYIEGTVDFIFGNGRSLYKNCLLNALNNSGQVGSLTAQKRNETTLDTGFSFVDSSIRGTGQVYLGRAWGNDSRVVFSYSYMDKVVLPTGWDDWGISNRDRTVYYAEFRCTGPGAAKNGERVPYAHILTAREAKPFLTTGFVNGKSWLPHL